MCKRTIYIFASILIFTGIARSQSLTDGIRLGSEPIGTGARAIAMGGAAVADANDFSSLDWNPAALTLVTFTEFTLSGLFKAHHSTASYLGTSTDQSLTNFDLGSLGYITPIETSRGHLAFGISYDRVRDYHSTYSFSAVNTNSSFLDTKGFVNDQGNNLGLSTQDYQNYLFDNNLAWSLFLTHDVDSAHPNLRTPFGNGGLLQSGTVTVEGGMNAFRLGGGIDIAENFALGATLNFFLGNYNYRRVYNEKDVNNIFTKPQDSLPPDNFQSAQIIDTRHQSQAGFSLKLGFLANITEHLQFGLTVESPEIYSIDDEFQRTGSSAFRKGPSHSSTDDLTNNNVGSLNPILTNSYTVTTPVKLAAGLSFNLSGLTLSGAADFSDQSQVRFSDAAADLNDLNDAAKLNLRAVLNWKLGAEYVFKPIGLILRGGFGMNPSPYKGDPSNYNTQNISGGIGILMSKSAIVEITYLRTNFTTDHLLYNDYSVATGNVISASIPTDTVVQNQFFLSFSFRF